MSIWRGILLTEDVELGRADRAILRAYERAPQSWEPPIDTPPSLSRSRIQKLIEGGKIQVGGLTVDSNQKMTSGSVVLIELGPPRPMELLPEDRALEILFEDEHLIVINKPPGLTVHPSETQASGTLVHALLHHVKDLSGIGGVLRPGIVHRIDKDTSGALVITKSDRAHLVLAENFARHDIDRRYWAWVYGEPERPTQRIESLIARNPQDRKRMSMDIKEGRRAVTHLRVLESFHVGAQRAFASLCEAKLETGRTHQVRVHLTGIGHSLLGDPTYGKPSERHTKWMALPPELRKIVRELPGQALHARILGFAHPITGQDLQFEAPLPPSLHRLSAALASFSTKKKHASEK